MAGNTAWLAAWPGSRPSPLAEMTVLQTLGRSPLFAFLGRLPPRIVYRLFWAACVVDSRSTASTQRAQLQQDIRRVIDCFPGVSAHQIDIEALASNAAKYYTGQQTVELLTLALALRDPKRLQSVADVSALTTIAPKSNHGTGAILATVSVGPFGLLPPILAALGVPLTAAAVASDYEIFKHYGRRVAPTLLANTPILLVEDHTMLVRAAQALRCGNWLSIQAEFPVQTHVSTTDVQIFGARVKAPLGIPTLAAKLNVEIVPVAITSSGNCRFQAVTGSPLVPSGSTPAETQRLAQALFDEIAKIVTPVLEQWLGWSYYAAHPEHGPPALTTGPSWR